MPGARRMGGSSPLVRGAPRHRGGLRRGPGIIPARAGSTCRTPFPIPRCRDHPRSCGEHYLGLKADLNALGSSPLVRGALVAEDSLRGLGGIIPARAGSTRLAQAARRGRGDHPRSCGEHHCPVTDAAAWMGSSPLVRGALVADGGVQGRVGIIPARAGSTARCRRSRRPYRDHPRSCGEHLTVAAPSSFVVGSSPLVRGAPEHPCYSCYVGGDHPRSCGEHTRLVRILAREWGSSPLVRGAPLSDVLRPALGGIIPARAGSTFPR